MEKARIISTALLGGFLMGIFISCSSSPELDKKKEKAEIYYGRGTSDLVNKDYTSALRNLLEAHQLDPDDSKITNNLGMAYYFKKQIPLSLQFLEKSLKLDPKNSDARINLASVYFSTGDYGKAEEEYLKVRSDLVYSLQFRVSYNLGLIKLRQGDSREATKHFEEALEDNENYCPAHFQLAKLAFSARHYEEAYKSFYAASRGTCYDEPGPHYFQALTLYLWEKKPEAKLKYQEIVTRFPDHVFAGYSKQKLEELADVEVARQLPTFSKSKKSQLTQNEDRKPIMGTKGEEIMADHLLDFTKGNKRDTNRGNSGNIPPTEFEKGQ